MFRDALLASAAAIVTCHQHPSGLSDPSDDDRRMWKRMRAAGELLGIVVLDNLVLGETHFYGESDDDTMSYKALETIMKRRYGGDA